MASNKLSLPNDWHCRSHQVPIWNAFMVEKMKRLVAVWHRRAGKDSFAINATACRMFLEPGLYYYLAPSQKHARKIIWDNIGSNGQRIINQAIPEQLRKSTNDQEMRIVVDCPGGGESIFQVVGSDNFDSIVGSNPKGLVFSEWAICQKPEAWDYFRPILAENGGWAMFIYTPRGMNHGYQTYMMAQNNPKWYCERLTVDDTDVLSAQQIQDERDAGMSEMKVQQEFYCDFNHANEDMVFDMDQVLASQQYVLDPDKFDNKAPFIFGIDCARFGDDKSVLAFRHGLDGQSIPPIILQGKDLVQFAQIIYDAANKYKPDIINIDSTGLGGGLVDILKRNYRLPVNGVHFSMKAKQRDRYHSIRTEMYCRFQEWTADEDSALWAHESIREELNGICYGYDPTDRIRIESKDDCKKRILHSPDIADAYALTFARDVPRRDAWQTRGTHQNRQAVIGW